MRENRFGGTKPQFVELFVDNEKALVRRGVHIRVEKRVLFDSEGAE